jgi:hypothetical protein
MPLPKSRIIYAAIIVGAVLSLIAWRYFDSPVAAAVIALACYIGCDLYSLTTSVEKMKASKSRER